MLLSESKKNNVIITMNAYRNVWLSRGNAYHNKIKANCNLSWVRLLTLIQQPHLASGCTVRGSWCRSQYCFHCCLVRPLVSNLRSSPCFLLRRRLRRQPEHLHLHLHQPHPRHRLRLALRRHHLRRQLGLRPHRLRRRHLSHQSRRCLRRRHFRLQHSRFPYQQRYRR